MKKFISLTASLAVISGIVLIIFGMWGVSYTYTNIAKENITTPDDASIPEAPVRGPLTLKAQADIIHKHALNSADGKTYAEAPRQIQQTDSNGNPVLDTGGEPVMISNPARSTWTTATTLITALNLAVLAYAFFLMMIFSGCLSLWAGLAVKYLNKKVL